MRSCGISREVWGRAKRNKVPPPALNAINQRKRLKLRGTIGGNLCQGGRLPT